MVDHILSELFSKNHNYSVNYFKKVTLITSFSAFLRFDEMSLGSSFHDKNRTVHSSLFFNMKVWFAFTTSLL